MLPKVFNPRTIFKRHWSFDDKRRIIYQYYGSMHDFRRPVKTQADVAKFLRIHTATVNATILRFQRGGYNFESLKRKQNARYKKLSPRLRRQLLSKRLLQQWIPFSMQERVAIIENIWGVQVFTSFLHRFY